MEGGNAKSLVTADIRVQLQTGEPKQISGFFKMQTPDPLWYAYGEIALFRMRCSHFKLVDRIR